jgi:hypothetical protein
MLPLNAKNSQKSVQSDDGIPIKTLAVLFSPNPRNRYFGNHSIFGFYDPSQGNCGDLKDINPICIFNTALTHIIVSSLEIIQLKMRLASSPCASCCR